MILSTLISISTDASLSSSVLYSIPDIQINFNEKPVDNQTLTYPIVMISGEYYYPLSWELSKMLGYDAHFSSDRILHLRTRTSRYTEALSARNFGLSLLSKSILPVTYPVLLDGRPMTSDQPLYNIGGITYLSIADSHDLIIEKQLGSNTLPSKYSTFDSLDKSLLIRNQGTESTCWAFAANTIFEIAIALETGQYHDFSETHLIDNAPIPSTVQSGGNFNISSMYYLNGYGPITASGNHDFTLLGYSTHSNSLLKTKDAIKTYGSALTSIYLNEEDPAVYNSISASYYNASTLNPRTHELVLVGWDDHYDKSQFITQPKNNGAFIALNSFGNSWGDEGLLYISYEDVHVLSETYSVTHFEKKQPSLKMHYYDKTGLTHFESYNNYKSVFGINNFTSTSQETLKRIGFFASPDATEALIYHGLGKFSGNVGSPVYTLKIPNSGYFTVDLPKPFSLTSTFWVGVEFKGNTPFLVPIEAPYPGINYPISANQNEGFIGVNKSFEDLVKIRKNASIAIRAITSTINH